MRTAKSTAVGMPGRFWEPRSGVLCRAESGVRRGGERHEFWTLVAVAQEVNGTSILRWPSTPDTARTDDIATESAAPLVDFGSIEHTGQLASARSAASFGPSCGINRNGTPHPLQPSATYNVSSVRGIYCLTLPLNDFQHVPLPFPD